MARLGNRADKQDSFASQNDYQQRAMYPQGEALFAAKSHDGAVIIFPGGNRGAVSDSEYTQNWQVCKP